MSGERTGERTFEERLAVLQEHIVVERPTAEEFLTRAERALAVGDEREARHCLNMARIRSSIDRLSATLDELDAEDDGGDDDA